MVLRPHENMVDNSFKGALSNGATDLICRFIYPGFSLTFSQRKIWYVYVPKTIRGYLSCNMQEYSKDPKVFNAQEISWKERPSLARFLLQRCSGLCLWRMKTPLWLKLSIGSIITLPNFLYFWSLLRGNQRISYSLIYLCLLCIGEWSFYFYLFRNN